MSEKRRVSAPSKRITATASETIGSSTGPNTASGSSQPMPGPMTRPVSSRKRMAGSLVHQATHWQVMPSSTTAAI